MFLQLPFNIIISTISTYNNYSFESNLHHLSYPLAVFTCNLLVLFLEGLVTLLVLLDHELEDFYGVLRAEA